MKYTILLLSIFLALSGIIHSQGKSISGEVVDVIDGRTFTLDSSQARFTIQLQFVDTPEVTQPLHDIVKQHLTSLAKNKQVFVQIQSVRGSVYIGKAILNGTDLSMQLLRDGGAWYSLPEAKFQPIAERFEYQELEKQAKVEKRGIWGIAAIRPAYELRLEREKADKERLEAEQKALAEKISRLGIPNEPVIGITRTEFHFICGTHPRDHFSVTDTKTGRTVSLLLYETAERVNKLCFGFFSFGTDGKLDYIRRTSR